jgi:hypothetical protein
LQSTLAFAQVPADSLTGIYVGKYWYASPPSNPWTKLTDTISVYVVDSINCKIQISADPYFTSGGTLSYYSSYYSCNTPPPVNYFNLFYNNDSLKMIDDNVPQPPPNQSTISRRFYGKRVAPYYGMGVKQFVGGSNQISIYPNPASTMLHVELKMQNERAQIQISNTLGQEVISTKEKEIDVSSLQEGIYFVQIKTNEGITTQKVIIHH